MNRAIKHCGGDTVPEEAWGPQCEAMGLNTVTGIPMSIALSAYASGEADFTKDSKASELSRQMDDILRQARSAQQAGDVSKAKQLVLQKRSVEAARTELITGKKAEIAPPPPPKKTPEEILSEKRKKLSEVSTMVTTCLHEAVAAKEKGDIVSLEKCMKQKRELESLRDSLRTEIQTLNAQVPPTAKPPRKVKK